MLKHLAYTIASFLENTAHAIFDRIDMNPHAEPELYVSRECLEEMSAISRGWPQTPKDNAMLCLMLAQQETKH